MAVLPKRNTDQVKVTGASLTDIVEHRENFDGGLGRDEHRPGTGPIYASEPGDSGGLGIVNPDTGRFTLIGPFTGAPGSITEIEWSPDGKTLYATTGGGVFTLHTIDPNTGTIISTVALSGTGAAVNGLEFDGSGTLFGTTVDTGGGDPSTFVSIDPVTGVSTGIGLTGHITIGGLAFDPSFTTLFGVTSGGSPSILVTIVIGTGVATAVGPAVGVEMSSLEFTADGRLIAGGNDGNLYEMDTATGAATVIGRLGTTKVSGLSMQLQAPAGPRVHDLGISEKDFVAQSAQRSLRQFVRVPGGSSGLVQPEKVGGLLFPTEETP